MPVRVKGKTFGLAIQETDAWIIPETSDPAPHAVVAPEHRKLQRHQGQQRLKPRGSSEKPVTLQKTGRARDSWDNRSARAPVWGTEATRPLGQGELRVPRAPDEPSPEERARHEITHLQYQPWCAWCVRRKVVQNLTCNANGDMSLVIRLRLL